MIVLHGNDMLPTSIMAFPRRRRCGRLFFLKGGDMWPGQGEFGAHAIKQRVPFWKQLLKMGMNQNLEE